MDNNQIEIDFEIKIFNLMFLADMTIGSIAGLSTIFISGLHISESHKAHLLLPCITIALLALIIFSLYTTLDQYHRIRAPFRKSIYKLTTKESAYLCFFGIMINLGILTSIIVLLNYAIKSPLSLLTAASGNEVGVALLFIGISCLIQSLYIALSLVKWIGNFKALLLTEKSAPFNKYKRMLACASRGAGSFVELMIGWFFLFLGFLFLSLKSFNLIYSNNFSMTAPVSIGLFATSLLFIFASYMGGHPNSECLRNVHVKRSYITKIFRYVFEKNLDKSENANKPLLQTNIELSSIK